MSPVSGWLAGLGVVALLVMFVTTLVAVVARFFDVVGLEWSYEVAGIAFVWTTFLGAAFAESRRENAAFEILRARLPGTWTTGLERFGAVLLLVVGGTLVASGVAALWRSAWVPTPLLRWPSGLQIAAAPVLGACLCGIALARLFRPQPGGRLVTALPQDGTGTPL